MWIKGLPDSVSYKEHYTCAASESYMGEVWHSITDSKPTEPIYRWVTRNSNGAHIMSGSTFSLHTAKKRVMYELGIKESEVDSLFGEADGHII